LRLPGSPGSLFFDFRNLLMLEIPMRKLALIATFALAACGGSETVNNSAVAEEASATEIGAANDATAIDAATGQAANMAADVDYTFNEGDSNVVGDNAVNRSGNTADNSAD